MRVLVLSTSTNNTDTVINSLDSLDKFDIEVFRYDDKYHSNCQKIIAQDEKMLEAYRNGFLRLPYEHSNMDVEVLETARDFAPEVILYISAWTGDYRCSVETLGELNKIGRLVHILFDQSDPPWLEQLKEFEERGVFSLTVGIDGGHDWPGGRDWRGDWIIKNALTLLTPLDPAPFIGTRLKFDQRPFPISYNGNANGWIRSAYVQRFQKELGSAFFFRTRDERCDSYCQYIDFMRHSQVTINIPFTGSSATRHVKGRVLEAGFSGACLLELKNAATASWFTPFQDYWEYETVDEAIDLAKFLAGHPKVAESAARSLQHKLETHHSPEKFWKRVFEVIGAWE